MGKTRKNSADIGTVTCLNRPDPWRIFEMKALLLGEKFGVTVTVESLTDSRTGLPIPRRGETPETTEVKQYV